MRYTPLIATSDLAAHLTDPHWGIVDCRFDLTSTGWGEQAYHEAHIPGAVYAHLDRDLSGPKTGRNGRHPLPDVEGFKTRLGRWGISAREQVVAYDQNSGMWASRLWWMLRYLGHEAVAVLDGGLAKRVSEGRPTRAGDEQPLPAQFVGLGGGALPGPGGGGRVGWGPGKGGERGPPRARRGRAAPARAICGFGARGHARESRGGRAPAHGSGLAADGLARPRTPSGGGGGPRPRGRGH